ncbi:MAG TPA: DUF1592 domain-containing protein, partial [Polyangiaceae bacterium]|nr:DUF1592 domain-containing protein [Polyangiaceae bacterium]
MTFRSRTTILLVAGAVAGTSAACLGNIGDPPGGLAGNQEPEVFEPAEPVLPRLTAAQYRNTVVDLLGPKIPMTPIEADTNPYLFYNIGATSTTLSELGVQQFEESADAATRTVFSDPAWRAVLVGCQPAAPGDACAAEFLGRFGRRAFRRPLSAEELARYTAVAADLAQPDAWEGIRLAVAGMLQSPHFLYRVELSGFDAENPGGGKRLLNGFEMAARLSFLLWNTTPDEALLDAAARGDLGSPEGIAAEAERLLAHPRAIATIQEFFAQYLDLGRLDGIARSPATYPLFTPGMAQAMRKEIELLVNHVVFEEEGDTRSIFSTRRTFVNSELAALYGVEAPGADVTTFVPVVLDPDGPRAGLLTFGAFLTMNAHETQTSPTARGKYVRERVLCQTVQPPPPDVDTTLDPPTAEMPKTVRERLEEHRKNPACAACHAFIDPPGFLFEHFDSIGAYRTVQAGDLPIDSTGDLDGIPLTDAKGLAGLLEDDPRVGRCMVTQLFRHAQGRLDTKG